MGPSVPQLIQLSWQPHSNSLLCWLQKNVWPWWIKSDYWLEGSLSGSQTHLHSGLGSLARSWHVGRFIPLASPQCHLDNGATYQLERQCRWSLHFITLMTKNSIVVSYVCGCLEMVLLMMFAHSTHLQFDRIWAWCNLYRRDRSLNVSIDGVKPCNLPAYWWYVEGFSEKSRK